MSTRWTSVRWAENGEIRLAYDQLIEPVGGEPLLLVTGLGVSRFWWPDALGEALAGQGFAVARYDQRDAGESTHLPPATTSRPIPALFGRRGDAYTAEDMADDAIAVLDALGWRSAHLFGQSLGGAVAQRIALRHPDRVRTLTSVSAIPADVGGLGTLRYVRPQTLAKLARMKYPRTREGDIQAGLALARLIASPGYPFDEQAVLASLSQHPDAGVQDQQAQSRQIGAQWHGPSIDEIRVPTLVMHGADDPLIRPLGGRRVAARIPGARLVILPGVGHDLPDPVCGEVAAHVRRLADTAPSDDGLRT